MFQQDRSTTTALVAALTCGSLVSCSSSGRGDGDAPPGRATQAEVKFGQCETTSAGTGFDNDFFPPHTGVFSVDFDVQPHSDTLDAPIDGVIGLAKGPADAFTDLGPIVRFNPSGVVDARNGPSYAAEGTLAYHTDWQFYHVAAEVDVPRHTYSASVNEHGFPAVQIARDYAFRSEQRGMSTMDVVSRIVDMSSGASLQFCGLDVRPTVCSRSAEGSGWASRAFAPQRGAIRVEFDVTPLAIRLDAVIGVSASAPAAFRDLAAIFRLNPDGSMDARNGGAYAADVTIPYQLGQTYHVALDIDVGAHRYNVSVAGPPATAPRALATNYAFRTEQAAVGSLGVVGQFVDTTGTDGDVNVCDAIWAY